MSTVPYFRGSPIVGVLPALASNPVGTLFRFAATPVSKIRMGRLDVLTTHRPELADTVLRADHKSYDKGGTIWTSFRKYLGAGLPFAERETWRRSRKAMGSSMRPQAVADMVSVITRAVEGEAEREEIGQDWTLVDVGDWLERISMAVVCQAVLGMPASYQPAGNIGGMLDDILNASFVETVVPKALSWPRFDLRYKGRRGAAAVRAEAERIIGTRCQLPAGPDVLHSLLLTPGMPHGQLVNDVVALFSAGFETTATGLLWTLMFLAEHQDSQWVALVDPVGYGERAFREAIRLRPPAWWTPRTAVQDTELGGVPVKAGDSVAVVNVTTNRYVPGWSRPDEFNPSRFIGADSDIGAAADLSFGTGPRACVGKYIAKAEARAALAALLSRYEFRNVDGMPHAVLKATLAPATPRMLVRRRR